ncbi:hypothetical protein [Flavobacterium sp. MDT1-60]|uniref:hypothetical protein n=1 Tax=Flavobacterium sp. MDT1-60 TaxID=1979344 RepID=UPI00177E0DE6|nr:hypothetical protein [Flavobacterium sp. MDT1-60]QOG02023.1 hypothetical protein IHE43_19815 [Flavobacterium sp. MDT1-60]
MKKYVLLIAIIFLTACSSSKTTGDKWIGKTKQNLMKNWGTPIRVFDNSTNGEIFVYADQIYDESNRNNSREAGSSYWNYTYMYVDKNGKVSSFRNEKQNYAPQTLDSDKMATMNLLTAK